jgi:glucose-6-phosphate dehydrogenase assembly protein OpcA
LPYLVRSLLIGDLPTDLWWTHNEPPPAGGELFNELASMSNQVIYESVSWPNPAKSVVTMANWAARPDAAQTISDLGWRRLKPWRRILGQSLDPTVTPEALESITEVVVEHGPHMLQQVWLLVGWLACRLDWKPLGGRVVPGETLTWRFQSPRGPVSITARRKGDLSPEIHRLTLSWKTAGKTRTADFAIAGPDRLAVTMKDADVPPRFLFLPYQSRASLVAKQLPDRGRDELFDHTLQLSRLMAEALG